jgi:hypothetical protein
VGFVLLAPLAELLQFQTLLDGLLVLLGEVIDAVASPALHFDEIFLRHIG